MKRGGCRAHIKGILPAKLEFQVALHLAIASEGSVTAGEIANTLLILLFFVQSCKMLNACCCCGNPGGEPRAAADWTASSEWERWRG